MIWKAVANSEGEEMWARFLFVLAGLAIVGWPSFGTPVSETALAQREAMDSHNPQEPQTLGEIYGSIRAAFELPFAVESLPERCVGEPGNDERFSSFVIERGELLRDVTGRFETLTGDRYMFDVIRGIPILRRNPDVVPEPVLLDLIVNFRVAGLTIWDALCALAREVNAKALAQSGGKPLYIYLNGPQFLEFPSPVFENGTPITLALDEVSAREALCAILETGGASFTYSYICGPEYDPMTILHWGQDGKVAKGRRMEDTPADKEAMAYWAADNINKLQSSPGPDITDGPRAQDPATNETRRGSGWRLIVALGCVAVLLAVCANFLRHHVRWKK